MGRARLLAAFGGVGLTVFALASTPGVLATAGMVAGGGLVLVALLGRAPSFVTRLLSALGGDVP